MSLFLYSLRFVRSSNPHELVDRLVYTKAVELKESTAQSSSEPRPSDQSSSLQTVAIVVPIVLTIIILSAVIFLVVRFRRRQPKRKKRAPIYTNSLMNSLITPYTLQLSNLIGNTSLSLGNKLRPDETFVTNVRPISGARSTLPLPVTTSGTPTRISPTIRAQSAGQTSNVATTENGPQSQPSALSDIDRLVDLVVQRLTRWASPNRVPGRVPSIPPPSYSAQSEVV